jgi:hypothetical protein
MFNSFKELEKSYNQSSKLILLETNPSIFEQFRAEFNALNEINLNSETAFIKYEKSGTLIIIYKGTQNYMKEYQ